MFNFSSRWNQFSTEQCFNQYTEDLLNRSLVSQLTRLKLNQEKKISFQKLKLIFGEKGP